VRRAAGRGGMRDSADFRSDCQCTNPRIRCCPRPMANFGRVGRGSTPRNGLPADRLKQAVRRGRLPARVCVRHAFRIMKRHSFCWHMAPSSKLPPALGPRKCPLSREACRMSSTPAVPRRPILAPQGRGSASLRSHRAEGSSASSFYSNPEPGHDGVGWGIRVTGRGLSDFSDALSTSGYLCRQLPRLPGCPA